MRQIKLKLEEFFDRETVYKIHSEGKNNWEDLTKLIGDVNEIINSKLDISASGRFLKQGESRESIIDALCAYQVKKLPDHFKVFTLKNGKITLEKYENEAGRFYDPETRIITLTSWED